MTLAKTNRKVKKMKKSKVFKWINRIVTGVLMVLLVSVAAMVIITKISGGEPTMLGYQIKTVLSGSMEPDIKTGSIIAVEPVSGSEKENFKEGDVITFMADEDKLITHRITEVKETKNDIMYTTKGDNNNAPDSTPVLSDNAVAVYSGFTIPYIGYVSNFAQSKEGGALLLILPGLLLFGYSIITIWKALRDIDDTKNTADVK